MKKRTPTFIDQVQIATYYTKEDGKVYLNRSIGGEDWEKILTPYEELPYVGFKIKERKTL
jgi:hypothetical protein